MSSLKTKAHEHKLTYINASQTAASHGYSVWHCDACKRTSKELRQTHSYKCKTCDFDLCKECTQPIKTDHHRHNLAVTYAGSVYKSGAWTCDNCGTNSRHEGKLSWHCEKGCEFDLCFGCTRPFKSAAHRHTLLKSDPKKTYSSSNGWGCDICKTTYNHDDGEKPYECKKCHYDLCRKCMKDTEVVEEKVQESVQQVQTKMQKDLTITDGSSKSSEPAKVFISYQWDIQEKVLRLKKKLEAMKITCWMDTGKMMGGDDLRGEIDKGMRGCKIVVSCVTKAYGDSKACQQEVALADVLKKPILPVLFEPVTWPPEGPMAIPFAPLIYISCENGNLDKVIETIKSKTC